MLYFKLHISYRLCIHLIDDIFVLNCKKNSKETLAYLNFYYHYQLIINSQVFDYNKGWYPTLLRLIKPCFK